MNSVEAEHKDSEISRDTLQEPRRRRPLRIRPAEVRDKLLALRELIFETTASTDGVGELEETLKWGEPAYLTSASGSGSTLRINRVRGDPARYAMYVNCKTNLVETFKTLFPGEFGFEGQRAIVFDVAEPVPRDSLAFCIATALTYHRRKPAAAATSVHRGTRAV